MPFAVNAESEFVRIQTLDTYLSIALESPPPIKPNLSDVEIGDSFTYRVWINEEGYVYNHEQITSASEKLNAHWLFFIQNTKFTKPVVINEPKQIKACFSFLLRSKDPELWEWRIWDPTEIDSFPDVTLADKLIRYVKPFTLKGWNRMYYSHGAKQEGITEYSLAGRILPNEDMLLLGKSATQSGKPVNHEEIIRFNNPKNNSWNIGIFRFGFKDEASYWEIGRHPRMPYPAYYAANGIEANVQLRLLINKKGEVQHVYVKNATAPVFGKVAREQLYRWKFKHADPQHAPFSTVLDQNLRFTIGGMPSNPIHFKFPDAEYLKVWPNYNELPEFINMEEPVYPYHHLLNNREGKASVEAHINEKGIPSYVRVISATDDEFGHAALAAMQRFRLKPAAMDGKPVPFKFTWTFHFNTDELIPSEYKMLGKLRKAKLPLTPYEELDKKIEPIFESQVIVPKTGDDKPARGSAKVRFLLNEYGHVLFPEILECSDPLSGYAIAQGLLRSDFSAPKKDGKPVTTQMTLTVKH